MSIHISSAASGDEPTAVQWDRPSLVVGSAEDCDLRLPHAEVSSRHTYFQFIDGRLYCADLASNTGTHWSNGAAQAGWVEANEPVAIGPYSLTFDFASPPRTSDAAGFATPSGHETTGSADVAEMLVAADMFLDFVNAGPNVRRYRVTREVTLIGSGDAVKIHLMHASVANVHCGVVRTPTGLWLVDLLSSEGTIVNGQMEPVAALQPGDEFQVGRFLVAVHYGRAEEPREPSPQTSAETGWPVESPTATSAATLDHASHPFAEDGQPAARSITESPSAPPGSDPHASDSVHEASHTPSASVEGISEQFVLNIVRELGTMQQQCLQQVQDSLREALAQLSSTYEQRLEALEREQANLRKQLADRDLIAKTTGQRTRSAMPTPGDEARRPPTGAHNGTAISGDQQQEMQDSVDVPAADAPQPPMPPKADANDRGQWIREQIKSIELELEKTGRGWEKKLVELLGH